MGVDCNICLPHTARVDNVADVLASLAGAPGKLVSLGTGHSSYFQSDAQVNVMSYVEQGKSVQSLASCLEIEVDAPPTWSLVTGDTRLRVMWFFDFNVGSSLDGLRYAHHGRGLKPRSTGFWIAAARGLVDFFGGWADFNDSDDIDVDYERPEKPDLAAHDGLAWQHFQNRLASVQPLTSADLDWAEPLAAYKKREYAR
jgi:hypothetical protein